MPDQDPLAFLTQQLDAWRRAGTWQPLRVLESESAPESRFVPDGVGQFDHVHVVMVTPWGLLLSLFPKRHADALQFPCRCLFRLVRAWFERVAPP